MERTYRYGARQIAVSLRQTVAGRFAAQIEGQPHEVDAALLDGSTLQLAVDGVAYTLQVARVGDAYHVAIAGEVYVIVPSTAGGAADDHAPTLAPPQIVAPMPGRVLQVLVRAGQDVAAGDGLLILEAMKMEHRIVAEASATVRAVHVGDGQMVDAGAVLVDLDYTD